MIIYSFLMKGSGSYIRGYWHPIGEDKEGLFVWSRTILGTIFITYDVNEPQCLLAVRDGFDAESPSMMLTQLHRLEACLAEGAIPNATLVRKNNRWASSSFHININDYHDVCMYVEWLQCPCLCTGLASNPRAKKTGEHRRGGLSAEREREPTLPWDTGILHMESRC